MRRSVGPARSRKCLVFLNRFFYPDHSATSQIVTDLAFHLAGSGADVHVITSQQRYDSPRASLPKTETVNGEFEKIELGKVADPDSRRYYSETLG